MSPSEKLKRIRLIGEQLYIRAVIEGAKQEFLKSEVFPLLASSLILRAQTFVDEFEKFENDFLKENSVQSGRPPPLSPIKYKSEKLEGEI